jgi:hypothetical protein
VLMTPAPATPGGIALSEFNPARESRPGFFVETA